MDGDSKKRARRRALRAAQVVTIALALGTGCSDKDGPGNVDASSMDSAMADSAMMDSALPDSAMADAGDDTGTMDDAGPMDDAGLMDASETDGGEMDSGEPDATIADAGADVFDADRPCSFPPTTMECCTEAFCSESGSACFWDEESGMCLVAVPGPFVPPSMTA